MNSGKKTISLFILFAILSSVIFLFQNCDGSFNSLQIDDITKQANVDANPDEQDSIVKENNSENTGPGSNFKEPQQGSLQPVGDFCAFHKVAVRNEPIDADIFGPVPRINGKLPAEIPIGVAFDGPVPGTEYIRVSAEDGNGTHYYSSVQVWNSDMTKFMIGNGNVDDNRILDTTNNYSLLPQRVTLSTSRVWSNIDPNIIYGIAGKTNLYKLNIATGDRQNIYTQENGSEISFMGKPNIPDDDSKMVFLVRNENKLVTIDLKSPKIPRPILGELNWNPYGNLNMSGLFINFDHSGNWVLVKPNAAGGGVGAVLHRLTANLSKVEEIGPMCCHSDSAYNTKNESIVAETRWKSRLRIHNISNRTHYDTPIVVNPIAGNSTNRFPSYVSGRGQRECGRSWVLMSGEETDGSPNHPLILYKVDNNSKTPTFKALGGDLHSGKAVPNQFVNNGKQKAVISPDGNSIAFDSDGGVPGGELSTYILRIK